MRENKVVGNLALFLFTAALTLIAMTFVSPLLPVSLRRDAGPDPDLVLLVVIGLALLATVLGFLAFKRIRAKVACVGGLILFLVATGMYAMKLGH